MIKLANSSIYQKIEAKGKQEAQEIKSVGKQKAEALEKSILEGYEKEYKKIVDDATHSNADYLKTKITQIDQLAKQESLFTKKQYIDKAVEGAHAKMLKLSDKDLFDLSVKTIASEKIQGDEAIKVSKEDYSKYLNIFSTAKDGAKLDLLNAKLGKNYKLTLSKEPADIKGGFVLVGKTYDIDHSFVALLADLKDENEAEIAKILFGSGE